MDRKPYPSDVSDDEWALVAPYLTLMIEEAPQRTYPMREVFNGLRWIVISQVIPGHLILENRPPPQHTAVVVEHRHRSGRPVPARETEAVNKYVLFAHFLCERESANDGQRHTGGLATSDTL